MSQIAYKLFRMSKGVLYPLFVNANVPVPVDTWLQAEEPKNSSGKVQSRLGPLKYRAGWHSSSLPIATHIGLKNNKGKVHARRYNEVWASVEYSDDIDYQPLVIARGYNSKGKFVAKNADMSSVPLNGYYTYKTNPTMLGEWIISGSIKVTKVLTQDEVDSILAENLVTPMPWTDKNKEIARLDLEALGYLKEPEEPDEVTWSNLLGTKRGY